MEPEGASVNRTILAVLIVSALLSVAAGGSAPWRSQRVYGWEIMSKEERLEFRAEMRSYEDYEDQLAFWRLHVTRMKERVWNGGLLLEEPPEIMPADRAKGYRQAIFASYLMTGEEVEAYRAKERTLRNKKEFEAFRRDHEIAMKAKAWEKGLPIGPTPAERKAKKEKRESAKAARIEKRESAKAAKQER
jgi:hypothetical protein